MDRYLRMLVINSEAKNLTRGTIFSSRLVAERCYARQFEKIEIERSGKVIATLPYWQASGGLEATVAFHQSLKYMSPLFDFEAQKTKSINRSKSALIGEIISRVTACRPCRQICPWSSRHQCTSVPNSFI